MSEQKKVFIDRDHFDERVRLAAGPDADEEFSADFLDGVKVVLYMLSTETPADVAPIVKSTWGAAKSFSYGTEDVECNNCGEWFNSHELCGRLGDANFCPNCGAAMSEEAVRMLKERSGGNG